MTEVRPGPKPSREVPHPPEELVPHQMSGWWTWGAIGTTVVCTGVIAGLWLWEVLHG
ncbi:hypothetical protein [Mycetocola saprophilus]|uniref:hypothetical protein n=1 Tax=Mycetocola saprophilus TaxID=76636 RepID=UPI003BF1508E